MCLSLKLVIAAQSANQLFIETLPWLVGLGVIVFIGAWAIYFVRKMMQRQSSSLEDGFTLHDLRQLHAQGELNDEEFKRAKDAMIGRLQDSIESDDQIGHSQDLDSHEAENDMPDNQP